MQKLGSEALVSVQTSVFLVVNWHCDNSDHWQFWNVNQIRTKYIHYQRKIPYKNFKVVPVKISLCLFFGSKFLQKWQHEDLNEKNSKSPVEFLDNINLRGKLCLVWKKMYSHAAFEVKKFAEFQLEGSNHFKFSWSNWKENCKSARLTAD